MKPRRNAKTCLESLSLPQFLCLLLQPLPLQHHRPNEINLLLRRQPIRTSPPILHFRQLLPLLTRSLTELPLFSIHCLHVVFDGSRVYFVSDVEDFEEVFWLEVFAVP